MTNLSSQSIEAQIKERYGSLKTPTFGFLDETRIGRPYQGMLDDLLLRFFVNDATNTNQDVSLVYVIRDQDNLASTQWMLQLSLVSRYGVLFALTKTQPRLLSSDDLTSSVRQILDLAQKWKIPLLSDEVLSTPVGLSLFYTEPENVCIYQALFSDIGVLPWKTS